MNCSEMTLEEYVKPTLLEISNRSAAAQQRARVHMARGSVEHEIVRMPPMTNFEGRVIVKRGAWGAIPVWTIGDIEAGASSEHTRRVSFGVPVSFQVPTAKNNMHFSRKEKQGER